MQTLTNPTVEIKGREIVLTRMFNAPRELVYKLWTDPKHVAKWWGPDGFTTPVCEIDLRPKGAYRFVMRGPDGAEFPMKGVYLEIVKNNKIVCTDIVEEQPAEWKDILEKYNLDTDGSVSVASVMTVTFDEVNGKTKLTIATRFKSEEARDAMLKMMMVEGWTSSLQRLENLLNQ